MLHQLYCDDKKRIYKQTTAISIPRGNIIGNKKDNELFRNSAIDNMSSTRAVHGKQILKKLSRPAKTHLQKQ